MKFQNHEIAVISSTCTEEKVRRKAQRVKYAQPKKYTGSRGSPKVINDFRSQQTNSRYFKKYFLIFSSS